jgi:hypothetical protein
MTMYLEFLYDGDKSSVRHIETLYFEYLYM